MRIIVASIAVITAALAAECPPKPAPAPMGDAAPPPQGDASTPSVAACANLAASGCAEGMKPDCASTIDHVLATRLTTVDLPCLTTKHTKVELRICGFVECK